MTRVVLDTNVLVSGLLNPDGAPGTIVRMVGAGLVTVCFDARILAEYRAVLLRPRFGFQPEHVAALLLLLKTEGEPVAAPRLDLKLEDETDAAFIEVAVAARVPFLVTGNAKHFPAHHCLPARVVTPVRFLSALG